MAKQVTAQIKLQCPGGQATPAPPVGPALGQHGVNIGKFVQEFNAKTADLRGMTVPVVMTVKVPAVPTANVALLALVMAGAWPVVALWMRIVLTL